MYVYMTIIKSYCISVQIYTRHYYEECEALRSQIRPHLHLKPPQFYRGVKPMDIRKKALGTSYEPPLEKQFVFSMNPHLHICIYISHFEVYEWGFNH